MSLKKKSGNRADKKFEPSVAIAYVRKYKDKNEDIGEYISLIIYLDELRKYVRNGENKLRLVGFEVKNKASDKTPDFRFSVSRSKETKTTVEELPF